MGLYLYRPLRVSTTHNIIIYNALLQQEDSGDTGQS